MRALVVDQIGSPLTIKEIVMPALADNELLVQIKAAAFNRRDWWIQQGKYAGLKFPIVLGSDGSGIVAEVGADVSRDWMGKHVIINPATGWGDSNDFQQKDFKILGLPNDGTFAEYVKISAENIYLKPVHLNWEQSAALPLAGVTAYRALFKKAQAKKGDTVLISGVGSGTGTFALQWALAAGCRVFVTTGTTDKLQRAKEIGAFGGVNYHAQDWAQQLQLLSGGFDIIIDSALGEGFEHFLVLAKPGCRIVFFGGTAGNIPELNGRKIFWKQLQILGTTMGSPAEFEAMIEFVNEHEIIPIVDEVFSFTYGENAMQKLDDKSRFGKIVLRVS